MMRDRLRVTAGPYVGVPSPSGVASARITESLFGGTNIEASIAAIERLASARTGLSVRDAMRAHEVGHSLFRSAEAARMTSVAAAVVEDYDGASEVQKERVRVEARAEPDVHALLMTLLISVRQQADKIDALHAKLDQLDKPTATKRVMFFLAVYGAVLASVEYHGFGRVWDELVRLWLIVHGVPQ
jgi:hypothetical protein